MVCRRGLHSHARLIKTILINNQRRKEGCDGVIDPINQLRFDKAGWHGHNAGRNSDGVIQPTLQ